MQAAAAVVEAQQALDDLLQQQKPLLPRSLQELRQHQQQGAGAGGGSRAEERWRRLQELSTAAAGAQAQLRLALQGYEECCRLVEVRRPPAGASGGVGPGDRRHGGLG